MSISTPAPRQLVQQTQPSSLFLLLTSSRFQPRKSVSSEKKNAKTFRAIRTRIFPDLTVLVVPLDHWAETAVLVRAWAFKYVKRFEILRRIVDDVTRETTILIMITLSTPQHQFTFPNEALMRCCSPLLHFVRFLLDQHSSA